MLIGAEFAMLVMGLYALITGKIPQRHQPAITGGRARIIGLVFILPLPLAFVAAIVFSVIWIVSRHDPKAPAFFWSVTGIEAGIVIACIVIAIVLQRRFKRQIRAELADEESNAAPVDGADVQADG